jgi:hypothetical protein
MVIERCKRNEFGFVAAKMRTTTITRDRKHYLENHSFSWMLLFHSSMRHRAALRL